MVCLRRQSRRSGDPGVVMCEVRGAGRYDAVGWITEVGGTGHRARSQRDEEKKGSWKGDTAKASGQIARPATEQGTQGWFGRLAVRHPSALSLSPSIDRQRAAAVRWITKAR